MYIYTYIEREPSTSRCQRASPSWAWPCTEQIYRSICICSCICIHIENGRGRAIQQIYRSICYIYMYMYTYRETYSNSKTVYGSWGPVSM